MIVATLPEPPLIPYRCTMRDVAGFIGSESDHYEGHGMTGSRFDIAVDATV